MKLTDEQFKAAYGAWRQASSALIYSDAFANENPSFALKALLTIGKADSKSCADFRAIRAALEAVEVES